METHGDYNVYDSHCVGQFVLLKKNNEDKGELFLYTQDKKVFPFRTVTLLSPQYADGNIQVSFPKPWIMSEDNKVIEEGAQVLVSFPVSAERPVVLGCLNPLGNQLSMEAGFRIDDEALSQVNNFVTNNEFSLQEFLSSDGIKKYTISNGSFIINVVGKGAIAFTSEADATLQAEEQLNLFGKNVELGGNNNREYAEKDMQNQRAEEVNIAAKKVYIGTSSTRFPDLKVDEYGEIENPKLQPTVMSLTLRKLLEIIIDVLCNGNWMGNGVLVKMTFQTQQSLITRVRSKLNKIDSEVAYVLKKGDIIK